MSNLHKQTTSIPIRADLKQRFIAEFGHGALVKLGTVLDNFLLQSLKPEPTEPPMVQLDLTMVVPQEDPTRKLLNLIATYGQPTEHS